jgi:hypothetical protein
MTFDWQLEPEYYEDEYFGDAKTILDEAARREQGQVFLVANPEHRLNFEFNQQYAVCELKNESSGDVVFALTGRNLGGQVPAELHLCQCCACCGVGMFWYRSRCHLPRKTGFMIMDSMIASGKLIDQVISDAEIVPVAWSQLGDISHNQPGKDSE